MAVKEGRAALTFSAKVREVAEPIALHLIAMCLTVASIWIFHAVLELMLGADAKLFGLLPIIDLAHTGDFVVFLRFIWSAVKEFKDV